MMIANIITSIRLLCVPLLIYFLMTKEYLCAAGMIAFCSASDLLDGYLARRYRAITRFGIILDPLADKFLVISVLIYFTIHHILPIWFVLIVFYRDFSILSGVLVLYFSQKESIVSSLFIGKLSAACNLSLSFFLCLEQVYPKFITAVEIFLWTGAFFIVLSFILYSIRWFYLFHGLEEQ